MAVIGVGIDVCDIERFGVSLERTPGLRERLFTPDEATRPLASLAARFAAKEALAKALGAPVGMSWHDAEIVSESTGRPRFEVRGTVAAQVEASGATSVHVSLSHDAGVASAVVILESARAPAEGHDPSPGHPQPDQVRGDPVWLVAQLPGGAAQVDAVLAGQAPLPSHVLLPVLHLHVEAPVDLQDDDVAARRGPLAVGVSRAPVRAASSHLPSRAREPVPLAQAPDVELGHRRGPALDLVEAVAEHLRPPERPHQTDPLAQRSSRGQALLDRRADDTLGGAW